MGTSVNLKAAVCVLTSGTRRQSFGLSLEAYQR